MGHELKPIIHPHPSAVAATSAAIAVALGSASNSPSLAYAASSSSSGLKRGQSSGQHSRGNSLGGNSSIPSSLMSSSKVSTPDATEKEPYSNLTNSLNSSTSTNQNSSRVHKRKPSLATLWAFAEGVEHHTRVRGIGEGEGRGHSRSASPSGMESGFERRALIKSPTIDEGELEDWENPSERETLGIPIPNWGKSNGMTSPLQQGSEFLFNQNDQVGLLGIKKNTHYEKLRSISNQYYGNEDSVIVEDGNETVKQMNFEDYDSFTSTPFAQNREFLPEEPFLDITNSFDPDGSYYDVAEPFRPGDRMAVGQYFEGSLIRDFKEFEGHQQRERELAEREGEGKEVEVVRVLGTGTYAIVYLVREVLYDPYKDSSKDQTFDDYQEEIEYGKEYALKCLSKKDLSDELLLVQRSEVTLHKSLPAHPNIVTLRRAYENDSWLFILMDYTPGQDLFFWLHERANADADSLLEASKLPINSQHTPPSPSLLASTASTELLSRPRLRLVSRMFVQMCSAVAACHDLGISHRDIKPENFIVMEDVDDGRVIVKLTDWGLGTNEEMCTDFDTGSKPYMSYECRNNLRPSYDPRKADVWSLGICLINMLFHRSPWFDPTTQDREFSEFRQAPVRFLTSRFEGMGRTVATFLADRVFCDVLEEGYDRVSAREFGKWAERLLDHLGGGRKKGSFSFATIPLTSIVSRPSMAVDPRLSSIFQAHFVGMPSAPRPNFAKMDGHFQEYNHNTAARTLLSQYAPIPEITDSSPPASPQLQAPIIPLPVDDEEEVLNDLATRSPSEGSTRSRRRKRGARRSGRSREDEARVDGDISPPLPSPPAISVPVDPLNKLAKQTESFARNISKASKKSNPELSASLSAGGQSKDHLSPQTIQKKPSFASRVRSLVKDGNPELQAFKAQVAERNAALGVISAPAKMQQNKSGNSEISSLGSASVGTSSWGSWTSENTSNQEKGKNAVGSHWASASNRRTRLEQQKKHSDDTPLPAERYRHPNFSGSTVNSSVTSSFSSFSSVDLKPSPNVYRPPMARKENVGALQSHLEPISERSNGQPSSLKNAAPYGKMKDAATSTSSLPKVPEKTKLSRLLEGVKAFNKTKG